LPGTQREGGRSAAHVGNRSKLPDDELRIELARKLHRPNDGADEKLIRRQHGTCNAPCK